MRHTYTNAKGARVSRVGKRHVGDPVKDYKVEAVTDKAKEIYKKKLKDVDHNIIGS